MNERATRAETCAHCGNAVDDDARVVLLRGRRQRVHCSETCVREAVDRRRRARRSAALRWSARVLLPALVIGGAAIFWTHHRAPPRQTISLAWPEGLPEWDPPPAPIFFGPPWPPTDEQWTAVFDRTAWTFPLPGPTRRAPTVDAHIFGAERSRGQPPVCRTPGHCGLDLGGELWGEHVYAALDGVVERVVQSDDERRGGHTVRLSHLGGMVYTQYFHLAAMPRGLVRGAHVRAGDVIGLLGDTGLEGESPRRHLCFALSIRPSSELPEVYWDPSAWLAAAPLRLPPHGTVAGYVPPAPHGL